MIRKGSGSLWPITTCSDEIVSQFISICCLYYFKKKFAKRNSYHKRHMQFWCKSVILYTLETLESLYISFVHLHIHAHIQRNIYLFFILRLAIKAPCKNHLKHVCNHVKELNYGSLELVKSWNRNDQNNTTTVTNKHLNQNPFRKTWFRPSHRHLVISITTLFGLRRRATKWSGITTYLGLSHHGVRRGIHFKAFPWRNAW